MQNIHLWFLWRRVDRQQQHHGRSLKCVTAGPPTSTKVLLKTVGALFESYYSLQQAKTRFVATPFPDMYEVMLNVHSPYTDELVASLPTVTGSELDALVERAKQAQLEIAAWTLDDRLSLCERWIAAFEQRTEAMAIDVTQQMGKPLAQSRGEVSGAVSRARVMMALATEALADDVLPPKDGFYRKITHEPVGVVLAIAAWNYPLLIAVNSVIPAILAGNSVLLKHSERSPLCGDVFAETFAAAGAPSALVQSVHCAHDVTAQLVAHPGVNYAAFTGSVSGGRAVRAAANSRFIDVATELGGKDPAYVRQDADLDFTIPNLVEGATYNSGQSCCAIERIYVHADHYDQVLERAVELVGQLVLGDPMDSATDIGPIAQVSHPDFLASQVADARAKGARVLLGGNRCKVDGRGRFFQPTVIADVTHEMDVMVEESFGPIVAIQRVSSDDEALRLMNDSHYGLTASLWTRDLSVVNEFAPRLETGTVFMNRCDFLDPMLPWVGVKDTGRGVSLSKYGFGPLTRLKSYHFRL